MVDITRRSLFQGSKKSAQQSLPWLKSPETFTSDCTRCQKCLPVCETQIIVLGDGNFPTLDFQKDECTFCYACANSCPENLFLPENVKPWKQQITITEQCLAKNKVECRSCADSCEPQAIRFQLKINSVAEPIVEFNDCSGCGACLSRCPVGAISMKSQISGE